MVLLKFALWLVALGLLDVFVVPALHPLSAFLICTPFYFFFLRFIKRFMYD